MASLLPVEIEVIQHEWLWDLRALCVKSPSVAAGMSWAEEVYTRADGVHSIVETGLHFLKPMPAATYTATVYLHRFYALHSLQEYPIREIAVTCLFLGCKMADESRRLVHVVTAFLTREAKLKGEDPKISEATPEHKELVRKGIYYEDVLLRTLGYDLGVDQPYAYALATIQRIFGTSQNLPPVWDHRTQQGRPVAWYINELVWELISLSFYSPICIFVAPNTTAAAAVFLACRWAGADMAAAFEYMYRSNAGTLTNHDSEEGDLVTEDWNSMLQTQRKYVEWTASLMMDTMVLLPDQERTREMRRRTADITPDPNLPDLFGVYPNGTPVTTNGTSIPPVEKGSGPMETDEQHDIKRPEVPFATQERSATTLTSTAASTSIEQAVPASTFSQSEWPIGARTLPYQPDQQAANPIQPSPVAMSTEAQQPPLDGSAPQPESGELLVTPASTSAQVLQVPYITAKTSPNQPSTESNKPYFPSAAALTPTYPFIAVPSPRRSPVRPKDEAPTSLANLLNAPSTVEEEERLRVEGGEMKDEFFRPKADEKVKQEIDQSAAKVEASVKVEGEVIGKVDEEAQMPKKKEESQLMYEL